MRFLEVPPPASLSRERILPIAGSYFLQRGQELTIHRDGAAQPALTVACREAGDQSGLFVVMKHPITHASIGTPDVARWRAPGDAAELGYAAGVVLLGPSIEGDGLYVMDRHNREAIVRFGSIMVSQWADAGRVDLEIAMPRVPYMDMRRIGVVAPAGREF